MKQQELINQLIATSHNAAKAKGFWDEPRNQDEAFALILSEMFEAFEGHRKGKFVDKFTDLKNLNSIEVDEYFKGAFETCIKDTFEDEIADALIRLFDYCTGFRIDLSFQDLGMERVITDNFGQTLLNIVFMTSTAYINSNSLIDRPAIAANNLYYFLMLIVEKYSIDIQTHIELKLKYNATRGYKHGKQY
jgi:NTP pyrophosphatase (non-canonical NTP hydrolase)